MNNIVLFTGGFDPVHSGHIEAIKEASKYGQVVIGLNSDAWLIRKKGAYFMPYDERHAVMSNIKEVELVIGFDDSDGTACSAIEVLKNKFKDNHIIFVNGGDRGNLNTPEFDRYKDDSQVEFMFGVGGSYKKNSSSWILKRWNQPTEQRKWGEFVTYYDNKVSKIKRLILNPGAAISMQYHNMRNELWFVEEGSGVLMSRDEESQYPMLNLKQYDYVNIEVKQWHKLINDSDVDLKIIEIQYGEQCIEDDIVRYDDILI